MDSDLATSLRVAVQRLSRQLNSSATAEGLTPSQASVLALVVRDGPIKSAEIGRLEGINPTMVSRIVTRLEELDLIRRVPDPRDLRGVIVEMTPRGTEAHGRIRAQRAQVLTDALKRLNEADLRSLEDAVPAINALVETLRV